MIFSTVISTCILGIFLMICSGCNIQQKLLYYPSPTVPSEKLLVAAGLRFWPSPAGDYRGLAGSSEIRRAKGTAIVFHGNAGTAVDRAFYVKPLGALGYRVILAEYPGYGGRKGTPGEKAFVADARETVRLAIEQYGGPVYLLGESLGGGVAAAVVRDESLKIDGIVLITPWDSLLAVARSTYPLLPVRLLLKDRYDNIGNLGEFRGRIAVVGAERDEIVPLRHAADLYDSISGSARMMRVIKGAGHNDWPVFIDARWWQEIMDFISGAG